MSEHELDPKIALRISEKLNDAIMLLIIEAKGDMMDEKKGLIELGWFGEMPPRQEGMTASRYSWNPRGMVEHPEGVYMRFDDHVLATQREQITRLEGKLTAARDAAFREGIRAENLQARLTTSEAKRKWTRERPTVAGWYFHRSHQVINGTRFVRVVEIEEVNGTRYIRGLGPAMFLLENASGEFQGPLTPGEE